MACSLDYMHAQMSPRQPNSPQVEGRFVTLHTTARFSVRPFILLPATPHKWSDRQEREQHRSGPPAEPHTEPGVAGQQPVLFGALLQADDSHGA